MFDNDIHVYVCVCVCIVFIVGKTLSETTTRHDQVCTILSHLERVMRTPNRSLGRCYFFLKREGGHKCIENLERKEKAAYPPVFKILIREGWG